jgi:hypothetical protein
LHDPECEYAAIPEVLSGLQIFLRRPERRFFCEPLTMKRPHGEMLTELSANTYVSVTRLWAVWMYAIRDKIAFGRILLGKPKSSKKASLRTDKMVSGHDMHHTISVFLLECHSGKTNGRRSISAHGLNYYVFFSNMLECESFQFFWYDECAFVLPKSRFNPA